jgi:hydroxymethylpyrimidine/phosphomethylpyrimidine kinase
MSVKIPRALTIAGSDSGGGAGIQADLKTFAALGVHGMTAITAITAQNTVDVTAVQDVELDIIRAQIQAVADDIGVDAAKTGMLHTKSIVEVVSEEVEKYGFPLVVDPVMVSKSGAPLLNPEAKDTLVNNLLCLAVVVTPNASEAEIISGVKIQTLEDAEKAASKIASMTGSSVVVKGGHILQMEAKAVDILLHNGSFTHLEAERFETQDTHGTGCSFASAIAAELAKGNNVFDSVVVAKEFVNYGIKYGLRIGKGHGPPNPMANLWNDAERYRVIRNVGDAVKMLESSPEIYDLVAEVQMNIGMALTNASTSMDVAAVEGRLIRLRGGVRAAGWPDFGVSGHVSRTILAVKSFDDSIRAGMNLRYSEETIKACEDIGLVTSYYDRREEPPHIKEKEGMTTYWGASEAVKRIGRIPDVIYHLGDWGKEPMITIVGQTAVEVAGKALKVAKRLSKT